MLLEPVLPPAPATPGAVGLDDPALIINRDLSHLAFNARVLEEAVDGGNPLLERVKFLAILESNLDEFFMVRVAGLTRQAAAGLSQPSPDGRTPTEQLRDARAEAYALQRQARQVWREHLLPALAAEGIHVLRHAALSARQAAAAKRVFEQLIQPVLTPLAYDPGRPFPHISNLSINLAVVVQDDAGMRRFARIKVPGTLARFVALPAVRGDRATRVFVWLEDLIAAHLDSLFPGLTVVSAHTFRITRDADTQFREKEAEDLLVSIEQSVRERHFADVVRMEIQDAMPAEIRALLIEEMDLVDKQICVLDGPLSLRDLMALHALDRFDLKEHPFIPFVPPALDVEGRALFDAIRHRDFLLHHPYDAFSPVIDLLRAASRDPDVLAIKMTLYRVGRDSPVVDALLEARERGKQVAVLVELKARFDEASNIEWAKALEKEGVHVVYGLVGLKTHSKLLLIVRKEGERVRRYMHLGTGNYNPVTAGLYTDLGLLTADEAIGADATDLFNHLTGYSAKRRYRKLLVAPVTLRSDLERLVRREIDHASAGRPARLIFKINSLEDTDMVRLLYEASRAGVTVDLMIRGICSLRPGIPGVSERIQVISVVGRFLEHSRIYHFGNDGRPEVYVGSADLMPRNLDRRVEVLFPVEDQRLVAELGRILDVCLADTVKARRLLPEGSYERLTPAPGEAPFSSQGRFLVERERLRREAAAAI
jgi:polyphosphate kinase